MRSALILVSIVAAFFTGCVGSPNQVTVTKEGIKAYGDIHWKREQIRLIEINPSELSEGESHDLWIGLSSTKHMTFAKITEDAIKTIGVPSTNYYSASNPESYFVCGYDFDFKGGQFVGFIANQYGNPPKETTAFVKLGSLKSGSSLSLPCSVDDFEKVFGKADAITRQFSW